MELDLGRVRQMGDPATDDGRQALRTLYRAYVEDMRAKTGLMREAAASGDASRLRKLAHEQKGASGMVGARLMAERCAEIEARSATPAAASALIDRIESRLADLEADVAYAVGG